MVNTQRRVAVYARISRETEESVSVARQLESCRRYAQARGWAVVGEFVDDVSATNNRPEDREGWTTLLAAADGFDAVVVWKVDRLARRVLDFLHADEALRQYNAGLVAVEDPIDMTTSQGRAFATMLAVFGEMEAEAIRARVKDARDKLLRDGRWPGGSPLFGYKVVPLDPERPKIGKKLAKNPDEQEILERIVKRTQEGRPLYDTLQWLNTEGTPTRNGAEKWRYNTLNRLVRHPLLAGLVPHNPGRRDKKRGDGVVRDEEGMRLVHEELAMMSLPEWDAMQAQLADYSEKPHRKPRHLHASYSGLLSGLVFCAMCSEPDGEPVRMYRGTTGPKGKYRAAYYCTRKGCQQTMSAFEHLVIQQFLDHYGEQPRMVRVKEVHEGGSVRTAEIQRTIDELYAGAGQTPRAERKDLYAKIERLEDLKEEAERQPAETIVRIVGSGKTWREEWEAAEGDEEQRRTLVRDAIDAVWVRRGIQGAHSDARKLERMTIDWKWDEALTGEDAQRFDATIEAAHGADRVRPWEPPADE